jgi:hypothetical protein
MSNDICKNIAKLTILLLLTSGYTILLAVVVHPGQPKQCLCKFDNSRKRSLYGYFLVNHPVCLVKIGVFKVVSFSICRHQRLQGRHAPSVASRGEGPPVLLLSFTIGMFLQSWMSSSRNEGSTEVATTDT